MEIKAADIRVGNLYCTHSPAGVDIVWTVKTIGEKSVKNTRDIEDSYAKMKGIVVRQSMLKVHGFEETRNNIFSRDGISIEFNDKYQGFRVFRNGFEQPLIAHFVTFVLYWHQLQNLYFALIGKELTVPETSNLTT